MTVRLIQSANAILGESPLWCERSASLYWLDIKRPALYRHTPGTGQTGFWLLPELAGSVATACDGKLLVALKSGVHLFDPDNGELRRVAQAPFDHQAQRYNDGAVDRHGRFWVGSITDDGSRGGDLFCFDDGADARIVLRGLKCANGIGWSPDGKTMYVTDSGRRTIFAYDFDELTGSLVNERSFACIRSGRGVPDGLAVDEAGCVWSAIWDGWCIHRYAPDGELIRVIDMPVQRPTSVAFGGDDLGMLFVTSASINVNAQGLQRGPLAGSLFAVTPDVRGLPSNCEEVLSAAEAVTC